MHAGKMYVCAYGISCNKCCYSFTRITCEVRHNVPPFETPRYPPSYVEDYTTRVQTSQLRLLPRQLVASGSSWKGKQREANLITCTILFGALRRAVTVHIIIS